jgi:addiction module HigA family antidote
MGNNMRPIHPGEILRGEMEELGLSARQLALALKVPTNRVTGILNEQRAVTADTALWLSRYFGTAPEFWLNIQSAYELRRARLEVGE